MFQPSDQEAGGPVGHAHPRGDAEADAEADPGHAGVIISLGPFGSALVAPGGVSGNGHFSDCCPHDLDPVILSLYLHCDYTRDLMALQSTRYPTS